MTQPPPAPPEQPPVPPSPLSSRWKKSVGEILAVTVGVGVLDLFRYGLHQAAVAVAFALVLLTVVYAAFWVNQKVFRGGIAWIGRATGSAWKAGIAGGILGGVLWGGASLAFFEALGQVVCSLDRAS